MNPNTNFNIDMSKLSDQDIASLLKLHNIDFTMPSIDGQISQQVQDVKNQGNQNYASLQNQVNNMAQPGSMGSSSTGYMQQPGRFDMDRFGGAPPKGTAQYNMTPLDRANQMGITYNNDQGPGLSESQKASDPSYYQVQSDMPTRDLQNLAAQYGVNGLQPGMLQSNYAKVGEQLSPLHKAYGIGQYLDAISDGQSIQDHPELYGGPGQAPGNGVNFGTAAPMQGGAPSNVQAQPTQQGQQGGAPQGSASGGIPQPGQKPLSAPNTPPGSPQAPPSGGAAPGNPGLQQSPPAIANISPGGNWAGGLNSLPAPKGQGPGGMLTPDQNNKWYQQNVQKDADFWSSKFGIDPSLQGTYFSE